MEKNKSGPSWVGITLIVVIILAAICLYRNKAMADRPPAGGEPSAGALAPAKEQTIVRVVQSGSFTLSGGWSEPLDVKPWQKLSSDIYGKFKPDKQGYYAYVRSADKPKDVYPMRLGVYVNISTLDISKPQWKIVGTILEGPPTLRFSIWETDVVSVASLPSK